MPVTVSPLVAPVIRAPLGAELPIPGLPPPVAPGIAPPGDVFVPLHGMPGGSPRDACHRASR